MKKIMLALVLFATGAGSAIAGTNTGEVDAKVIHAFTNEFATAKEITWTITEKYYQASFAYNGQYLAAFYNMEGELLGLSRFISPNDLPLALQSDLKRNYNTYWISNLFEVANTSGTTYYITMEDADGSLVLKSDNARDWDNYKKIKKS